MSDKVLLLPGAAVSPRRLAAAGFTTLTPQERCRRGRDPPDVHLSGRTLSTS